MIVIKRDMSSSTYQIILLLILGLSLNSSCKKGTEDPALTLLTRKQRLDNSWKIAWYEREWKEIIGYDYTSGIDYFDGSIVTCTWENLVGDSISSGILNDTTTVSLNEFDIFKDGTFIKNWNSIRVKTTIITPTISFREWFLANDSRSGTWSFVGQEESFKNKERIIFNTTDQEITTHYKKITYVGAGESAQVDDTINSVNAFQPGELSETWEIYKLKSHAITLKSLENSSSFITITDTSGTSSSSDESYRTEITLELIER